MGQLPWEGQSEGWGQQWWMEGRTTVMNEDFLLTKKQENLPQCLVVILAMNKGVLVPPKPKVSSPKLSFDIVCFASGSTGIMWLNTERVWVPLPLPGPAGLETLADSALPVRPLSTKVDGSGEGRGVPDAMHLYRKANMPVNILLHNAGAKWNRNPPLWKWAAASKASVFGCNCPIDVLLLLWLMCD